MARLEILIAKRDAVNARIKREQVRTRGDERKKDTRRKVLAGAAVLEWAAQDSEFSLRLRSELEKFLVRDADRVLFGLAAKKAEPEQADVPL